MQLDKNTIKKILLFSTLYFVTGGIILSTLFFTGSADVGFPAIRIIIITFAGILLVKYAVYMFLSPLYDVSMMLKRRKLQEHFDSYSPLVSVVIPAWNESVGIVGVLKSLASNSYKHMEVIVVNDGSTDDTEAIVEEYIDAYTAAHAGVENQEVVYPRFIYYAQPRNMGKGHALNKAVALAHGEIIVSIDADCIVAEDAIQNFVRYFIDPEVMAAVGNVKIGNTEKIIGTVQYLEFLFSFYFKKADALMNSIYIIGGAAGAFRKSIFDTLGPYSTDNITEDIELSVRIQDAGMKIVYASDSIIYTEGAGDLRSLMNQRLRWKRGRLQTFLQYRHLFFSTKKYHNKLLTCLLLPLALFSELQLFLEIFFLLFLYVYSLLTNDFSSFISGIIIVSSMFAIQILFDEKQTRNFRFILLSPIGWLLFYLSTLVEYQALVRSIWYTLRGRTVTWQRWNRSGLAN